MKPRSSLLLFIHVVLPRWLTLLAGRCRSTAETRPVSICADSQGFMVSVLPCLHLLMGSSYHASSFCPSYRGSPGVKALTVLLFINKGCVNEWKQLEASQGKWHQIWM